MAITENLKKILAAVYGRDVRQSIHDSIQECYNNAEACKSYTNEHVKDMETKMAGITGQSKALMAKTRKDVRNVQAIFSVEKTVSITDGKLWEAQDAGSSCVLMEGAKTQCTTLNVQRGERYIIHTSMVSRAGSGRGKYPIIFAVDNIATPPFTIFFCFRKHDTKLLHLCYLPANSTLLVLSRPESSYLALCQK